MCFALASKREAPSNSVSLSGAYPFVYEEMKRENIELAQSYLLLNHGPVVMIGSAFEGRSNVMSASWVMPLDFDPPKILAVIDKNTFSRQLIEASGEFTINIPCKQLADRVLAAGNTSGRDGDKWPSLGLETMTADHVQAPLIGGCVGWLECRIINEPHNQSAYDLFIAEVVSASVDPCCFADGHWRFPDEAHTMLHYQSGGEFMLTGQPFKVGK